MQDIGQCSFFSFVHSSIFIGLDDVGFARVQPPDMFSARHKVYTINIRTLLLHLIAAAAVVAVDFFFVSLVGFGVLFLFDVPCKTGFGNHRLFPSHSYS